LTLLRFQIRDEIKAARIEATKALTRLLATLSRRERVNSVLSPSGREIEWGVPREPNEAQLHKRNLQDTGNEMI